MSIASLRGLPQFLRTLTTFPPPDAAMAALVAGPLASAGAVAARFWLLDGDDLVHAGGHGYTPDEIDRYRILAPDLPFVVWDAFRERRIVATAADAPRAAALETVDSEFRAATLARRAIETILRVPLLQDGAAIGALAVALAGEWPDDEQSEALATGVAAAVALWASSPESGAATAVADARSRARSVGLVLSDRERDILRLVEARVPTPAIAHALHVSESTVKAELQDVMRALATGDRVEAAARARALGLLP